MKELTCQEIGVTLASLHWESRGAKGSSTLDDIALGQVVQPHWISRNQTDARVTGKEKYIIFS